MNYEFDREVAIEESLEAQGYRPVDGKAKQEKHDCPFCDSPHNVSTTMKACTWMDVEYMAPVRHCSACNESWTDYEYEDAQLAAIKAAGYQVD